MGKKKQSNAKFKPKVNAKRAKFIDSLSKGSTVSDASNIAGYSPKNPRQSGYQVLEGIRKTMPEALEAAGLTDTAIIDKYLRPLLNANETKYFAHLGKVVSQRTLKNWTARTNGLDILLRIKGAYVKPPDAPLPPPQTAIGVRVVLVNMPRPKRPGAAPTATAAVTVEQTPAEPGGNTSGHKKT